MGGVLSYDRCERLTFPDNLLESINNFKRETLTYVKKPTHTRNGVAEWAKKWFILDNSKVHETFVNEYIRAQDPAFPAL